MKHLTIAILALVHYQLVCGQTNTTSQFLQTNSKSNLYYVDLQDAAYKVYAMGRNFDLGVSGYAILQTDTLQKQQDDTYSGRYFRIIREKDGLYLVNTRKRSSKFRLDTARDADLVNNNLNNAYYLDHYLEMNSRLEKAYPLGDHDFRQAFNTWTALPANEKRMSHLQFSAFADKRVKEINDSISARQERCTKLTNYVIQNIRSIDYTALKDSLGLLFAEYPGSNEYDGMVIDTVALRQPEFFFRLAEDLPTYRSLIFRYGVYNRKAHSGLVSVEGHDEMKKEFLKERRSNRRLQFVALGSAILGAALFTGILIILI